MSHLGWSHQFDVDGNEEVLSVDIAPNELTNLSLVKEGNILGAKTTLTFQFDTVNPIPAGGLV